ncbi:hypothetical protein BDM02DRAFT_3132662 [Thelephora ganbajun]|uniref:Uncharacterized protein n=1 Tax=Thelephora ganbajun TaxID=370292 RepID=A0ACB6Z0Q9_THEGA|nr:hypothetical protein BDM02DRAFT_3132662 [Thelephora ganbajun]
MSLAQTEGMYILQLAKAECATGAQHATHMNAAKFTSNELGCTCAGGQIQLTDDQTNSASLRKMSSIFTIGDGPMRSSTAFACEVTPARTVVSFQLGIEFKDLEFETMDITETGIAKVVDISRLPPSATATVVPFVQAMDLLSALPETITNPELIAIKEAAHEELHLLGSCPRSIPKIQAEGGTAEADWKELMDDALGRGMDHFFEWAEEAVGSMITADIGCPKCGR